jgi:hypothetical protein
MTFCTVSSSRDGMRSGRIPICMEYSARRAALFAERTAPKVASARTKVPAAVASEATVDQSAAMTTSYRTTEAPGTNVQASSLISRFAAARQSWLMSTPQPGPSGICTLPSRATSGSAKSSSCHG